MEKYIGTYHKSSPLIQNLWKKQICGFEILWQHYPPKPPKISSNLQLCADLLKSADLVDFPQIFQWTVTYMCLQKFPPNPPFADFLKSATG